MRANPCLRLHHWSDLAKYDTKHNKLHIPVLYTPDEHELQTFIQLKIKRNSIGTINK